MATTTSRIDPWDNLNTTKMLTATLLINSCCNIMVCLSQQKKKLTWEVHYNIHHWGWSGLSAATSTHTYCNKYVQKIPTTTLVWWVKASDFYLGIRCPNSSITDKKIIEPALYGKYTIFHFLGIGLLGQPKKTCVLSSNTHHIWTLYKMEWINYPI